MCHLGVKPIYYSLSLQFTVRDGWVKVSDSQNFWQGKDVYCQFCSEIYKNKQNLQEQMGDTDFSENEWTFGYCIQISKNLDTISKSLKIFIQFFIGYPNTCTWCGIQEVICSWLYELLMSLRRLVWKSGRYRRPSLWNIHFRFPSAAEKRRLLKGKELYLSV